MGLLLAITILSSFYLTPVAMRLAWRYDAVSRPDGFRKKHSRPTPEWGGLAVNASILVGIALAYLLVPVQPQSTPFLAALSLSVVLLCLLGCYDDLFDMRAGFKLAGQLLAVVPLIAVGAYAQQFTLFGYSIELGWLGVPWTVAWIVLGINALNLIDGLDGLASTVGITVAATIAVLAGVTGNTHIALVAVVLAGALGGFLAHNLPPARIYLGDCGSMVIGLVLATLALRVTPNAGVPNLTAMCGLLFIPLYDTILAIVRRGLNGNGIMSADRGHIHHRLLDRGLGVWGALALLATLSLVAGSVSWLVVLTGHELVAFAALVAVALLCAQLGLFGHQEWATLRDRLNSMRWRTKSAGYSAVSNKQSARGVAMEAPCDTATRRKKLDGIPQGQPSLTMGINVRLAAAPNATTATAGKKYVELLG